MKGSPIEWCDDTANPMRGCDGCELWTPDNRTCYAGKLTQIRAAQTVPPRGYPTSFDRVGLFPGQLMEAARLPDLAGTSRPVKPWLSDARRLIFVGDMGDILSRDVSFEYLEAEFIIPATSPLGARHCWLILTKRPARLGEFAAHLDRVGVPWPENIWVGTTVTRAATLGRLTQLLRVQGPTTRFVSVEPQFERLSLAPWLGGLSWVIQGGESGAAKGKGIRARPFDLAWARALRDECAARGVPYFLKQLGSRPFDGDKPLVAPGRYGKDWDRWPDDLKVRQMPHAAFPNVSRAKKAG